MSKFRSLPVTHVKDSYNQLAYTKTAGMKSIDQYFRCPDHFPENVDLSSSLSNESGYFTFGEGSILYGRTSKGFRRKSAKQQLYDVAGDVLRDQGRISLPFNPDEIVESLSHERYLRDGLPAVLKLVNRIVRNTYYAARPILPLGFRSYLQELYLSDWRQLSFPKWPVDTTIDDLMKKLLALALQADGSTSVPFIWFWPDGASSCAIMTHDVEEEEGRAFCSTVMDLNDEFQIPASFQIVPEVRYQVSSAYLDEIKSRGFEVNVQDLNHDGRLYWNLEEFKRRAAKINQYGREYGAKGFRAAILYRNQDWFDMLDFEYDMSTPNVAHLDPQRGGCCTVMPFFIGNMVELPVTTTQDHSMFHILHDYSLDLWRQQIAKIRGHHGLISFIVHPDYIIESRARKVYRDLLSVLSRLREDENVWVALPVEVNRWWRQRSAMTLEQRNGRWVVEGPGKERARVGMATLQGDRVVYSVSE